MSGVPGWDVVVAATNVPSMTAPPPARHHWQMAITTESIDQAILELDGSRPSADIAFDSDQASLAMANLLAVVATANSGQEDSAGVDWMATTAVAGRSIVERLRELITKLREALARLVETIQGVVSFSIGITGLVLSISINFGAGSD